MLREIKVSSNKKNQLLDITEQVKAVVKESRVKQGLCVVYVPHATAGIIINENYDPNICDDFIDSLRENIPEGRWRHDEVDNNAAAHIKAAIIGPSEVILVKDGNLLLGTWQNIMVTDFDGPKQRRVYIQVMKDN